MRSSGILMPISSLPSLYGIGSLGRAAYDFVDFLEASGQRYWQILPIGPTGYGDSPYQSFSSFAGNPYFIDLDMLVNQGLLTETEIKACFWGDTPTRVDYGALYQNRIHLLRTAVSRLDPSTAGFAEFCAVQAEWLEDYALFMAIKINREMAALGEWPRLLRVRDPEILQQTRDDLASEILFWKQVQYLFFGQWWMLKTFANRKGIQIIGDIPVYVSPDSSDLWAQPELFQVDAELNLAAVAGCPPDSFAPDGQLWGNPLYAWERHRETGYSWWIRRLKHAGSVYDVVRIDHFRGLESYFSIPGQQPAAAKGHWRKGPGQDFIFAIKKALPDLGVIAEDLGYVTPEVKQLLEDSGYPGMKVLQFAFDSREGGDYMPYNCPPNSVIYTGTHDNTTTEDWQYSAPPEDVKKAMAFIDVSRPEDFTWRFIRVAMAAPSETCIIPLQDYLCLGAEARINKPSTRENNWQWRVDAAVLTTELAGRIREITDLYDRLYPAAAE